MNTPEKNKQFMRKFYREIMHAKNHRPETLAETINKYVKPKS